LREINKSDPKKLDKIIEASGSSIQDRLKETVSRLMDCIHWHEEIAGEKGYTYWLKNDNAAG